MSRCADYTIEGFIYQFNKYLKEILNSSNDDKITIEGIIEDVEIQSANGIQAIQCKYHETNEKFALSVIYKPILQMMDHFLQNGNVKNGVEYKLYAHFPNETVGNIVKLTSNDISQILSSKNVKLQTLIKKIIGNINVTDFINVFSLEFGKSLDDLISENYSLLEGNCIPKEDIETLIYPNAIQKIAEISIKHSIDERSVIKSQFLDDLVAIRKTAITRWTMALKHYKKIIETRKKQLKVNLSQNTRARYFIMSENYIENFNDCIITFIKDFVDKYHFKPIHNKTPLFCLDCSEEVFEDIKERLYRKHIIFNDGLISIRCYDKDKFFKEPMVKYQGKYRIEKREFDIRLLHIENLKVINERKCDDLFIISNNQYNDIDIKDVEIEKIELKKIEEIKFIMGMRDTYEQ